jgi:phosphatidylglycerophosphate synthase
MPAIEAEAPRKDPRAAIKQDDGFVATFLSAPAANWLLRRAEGTPLTPNQVTAASAALAVAASAAFASGLWLFLVLGAVLLQLSFVLDCLDGQLARHRNSGSRFGAWLDFMTDCLEDIVIVGGVAIGCAQRGGGATPYLWSYAALLVLFYRRFDGLLLDKVLGDEYQAVFRGGNRAIADEGKVRVIAELRERKAASWGFVGQLLDRLAPRATEHPHALVLWVKRALLFREGERYLAISLLALADRPEWIFPLIVAVGGVLYPLTTLRRWQLFAP